MTDDRLLRLEANYRNLDRMNGWIANAEAKAGAVISASSLLLALASLRFAEEIKPLLDQPTSAQAVTGVIFAAYVAAFLTSIVHSTLVFSPRLRTSHPSPFFFYSISGMSFVEFEARMKELDARKIEEELIQQTYTNAVIASQKFARASRALRYFIIALLLGVLYLVARTLES